MTGYYTEALKESIYRWRKNHPDIYRENKRRDAMKYYHKHKARLTGQRHFREEFRRLANILL